MSKFSSPIRRDGSLGSAVWSWTSAGSVSARGHARRRGTLHQYLSSRTLRIGTRTYTPQGNSAPISELMDATSRHKALHTAGGHWTNIWAHGRYVSARGPTHRRGTLHQYLSSWTLRLGKRPYTPQGEHCTNIWAHERYVSARGPTHRRGTHQYLSSWTLRLGTRPYTPHQHWAHACYVSQLGPAHSGGTLHQYL
jgi:hypothetical protein